MAARSHARGHKIEYDEKKERWVYEGTDHVIDHIHYCSVCGEKPEIMKINKRSKDIDKCIAPIVKALNNIKVKTIACCCGHKRQPGSIILADGREILIFPDRESAKKAESLFPPIND